jgi:hypothetical protein
LGLTVVQVVQVGCTPVSETDSVSIFRVLISEPDNGEGFIEFLGQMNDYEILKKGLADSIRVMWKEYIKCAEKWDSFLTVQSSNVFWLAAWPVGLLKTLQGATKGVLAASFEVKREETERVPRDDATLHYM